MREKAAVLVDTGRRSRQLRTAAQPDYNQGISFPL
jgi:hypothetical protein